MTSDAFVRQVLAAVAGLSATEVEVSGDSALAQTLREALAATAAIDAPPRAVIVADGGASAIASATERVADGGRVVLAAEPEQPHVPLRTYSDIHVRGLTVVGIAPLDQLVSTGR